MQAAVIFWLVLAVVFAMLEAQTLGLTSIWFALGSAFACVGAIAHAPLWLQLVIFVVVSAVALLLTRKLKSRFNQEREPTNADRILGHRGQVLREIDNDLGQGQVRVDGAVWTARSDGGETIPTGADVVIRRIEGVKVIVAPAENAQS